MAFAKQITIKETIAQLRSLQKASSSLVAKRIGVLIEIKKAGTSPLSKRDLAHRTGFNHNSIQTWRTLYEYGGIEAICSVKKKTPKASVIDREVHDGLEKKLNDASNPVKGYVELNQWVLESFNVDIKYNTLLKYCIRHFKSTVKVARKSHILKDENAVATFKKTSAKSAQHLSKTAKPKK